MSSVRLRNDRGFVEEWLARPEGFRVEAVIHDGQWYTLDKWARAARVDRGVVEGFVDGAGFLIERDGSFRVSGGRVLDWYGEHGLDLGVPLVPNNFTPKLCGGLSEVECFLENPKRLTGMVLVYFREFSDVGRVRDALRGFCTVKENAGSASLRVYTVSPDYVIGVLRRDLPPAVFDQLSFRCSYGVLWRDLSDFSNEFVASLFDWYSDYARGALRGHESTLEIYLPDFHDRLSQVEEWILRASSKFDEQGVVPFSGYLTSVLQKWPYDLPNEVLGVELARFQRVRSRVVDGLLAEGLPVDEDRVQVLSGYGRDDYLRLLGEHNSWLAFRNSESLSWASSGAERFSAPVLGLSGRREGFSHGFSRRVLECAVECGGFDDFAQVLGCLDGGCLEVLDLSEGFKRGLWSRLG